MYSLTINFGPTGTAWAFLFKDKEKADEAFNTADYAIVANTHFRIKDDFGQVGVFAKDDAHGLSFEDLEQVEAARIYRSLAEERLKVKLMEAARADPTIRAAMNQARPPVLTPMGGFRAS